MDRHEQLLGFGVGVLVLMIGGAVRAGDEPPETIPTPAAAEPWTETQTPGAVDGSREYLKAVQERGLYLARQLQVQSDLHAYPTPGYRPRYAWPDPYYRPAPMAISVAVPARVWRTERRAYRGAWQAWPVVPGAYAYPYVYPGPRVLPYPPQGTGYGVAYPPTPSRFAPPASEPSPELVPSPQAVPTPPAPMPEAVPAPPVPESRARPY